MNHYNCGDFEFIRLLVSNTLSLYEVRQHKSWTRNRKSLELDWYNGLSRVIYNIKRHYNHECDVQVGVITDIELHWSTDFEEPLYFGENKYQLVKLLRTALAALDQGRPAVIILRLNLDDCE